MSRFVLSFCCALVALAPAVASAAAIRLDLTLAFCTVNPSAGAVPVAIGNYNFTGDGSDDCVGTSQLSPFSVNLGGTLYSTLSVQNDGLVTFGTTGTGTGSLLDAAFGTAIAPFMTGTDFLASSGGTPRISYGGTAFSTIPYLSLNYESGNSNSYYQMNLFDRSADGALGDFDLEINFALDDLDSGVRADQGGAFVGFNNGAGQAFLLPGSGDPGAFIGEVGDCGTPGVSPLALACNSFGSAEPGRYLFQFRDGVAIGLMPVSEPGVPMLMLAGLVALFAHRRARRD